MLHAEQRPENKRKTEDWESQKKPKPEVRQKDEDKEKTKEWEKQKKEADEKRRL